MKKSLKTKVTVYVLLAVLIGIFMTTIVNVIFTQQRLENGEQKFLETQVSRYANEVDGWIKVKQNHAEDLAKGLEFYGARDYEYAQGFINSYYKENSDIYDIILGYEDGTFLRSNPNLVTPKEYDHRIRGWYKRAKEEKRVIVTDPYLAVASQKKMTTIAAPVFDGDEVIGVLGLDVTLDVVEGLMDDVHFAEGSFGYLVNEEGQMVTEVLQEHNERTHYYAKGEINACGWSIYVAEPKYNVRKHIVNEVMYSVLAAILVIVFVSHVITVMIRRMLRPVENMVEVTKNLSYGYFDETLDRTAREDEIGVLQNSLANLMGILQIVIEEETYILGEICSGNLQVEEMTEYPGQFNDLSLSVNAIPITLNNLIRNIQEAAMNLESTIIAIESAESIEERMQLAEMLSVEVNTLMESIEQFNINEE